MSLSHLNIPTDIWHCIIEQADFHTLTTLISVSPQLKAMVERYLTIHHKQLFKTINLNVVLNMRRINFPSTKTGSSQLLLSVMHTYTLEFIRFDSGKLHFKPTFQDTCELTTLHANESSPPELKFVHSKPEKPDINEGELMFFEMVVYRFQPIYKEGGVEKIECVLGEMDSVSEVVVLPSFALRFKDCKELVSADFSASTFQF